MFVIKKYLKDGTSIHNTITDQAPTRKYENRVDVLNSNSELLNDDCIRDLSIVSAKPKKHIKEITNALKILPSAVKEYISNPDRIRKTSVVINPDEK